jgi:predicted amidohydrolase
MRSHLVVNLLPLGVLFGLTLGSVTQGAESDSLPCAKMHGRLASRMVGVSSICYLDGRIPETEKLIDAAALDKPDLILLTEGCLQNSRSSASRAEKDARSDPLPQPGPITQFFARKARQYHCYIMACYWRKAPHGPGRYNSAVLFDREGKVQGWYDKMFPTIGEMEDGVLPGRGAAVFDTDFGRVGAMICFDFNFSELLAEYKKQGAELICFLSNYRAGKLIPAAALRNECFIASSVPGENGLIVDPLGRTLAESSHYGRIIFARLNLDSRVVHIDYNADRVRRMKEKYGPLVTIETASPEAVYFLSSLHPEKSIGAMIEEFQVETWDAYLDRARAVRKQNLPKAK